MKPQEEEEEEEEEATVVSELRRQLEDEGLTPEQKMILLTDGLNKALNSAAVRSDGGMSLMRLKSRLYDSGVLSHCVGVLAQHPSRLWGDWSAAATLAQIISSCCVGVESQWCSEAFNRLFLPLVVDGLLSLAAELARRLESAALLRKVMDAVGWLLAAHAQLAAHILSSTHYEQILMCDDVTVSLLCVQMWIHTCTANTSFLSALSSDAILLLLNEAVGQLALSSDLAVGGASVRLVLLMASQLKLRLRPLLLTFKGLDDLLNKDWRGRGFDQEVDQLIALIQSEQGTDSGECVRAACVIQAAWRSFQTRRRVKNLHRAVGVLQRSFRARRRQHQQQKEAQLWEEELRYRVCVQRQQARRKFHEKQMQLLQLLPPDQVQLYLRECERRAAVVIQSFWRGYRERRHYKSTVQNELRQTRTRERAARTLQGAVRRFLQNCRAAKTPPLPPFWIGQKGLTDSRRAELKSEVDKYIATHPSSRASPEECSRLHEEVQLLLLSELRRGAERRREEQREEVLLAHIHTQVERLRDAPPLSTVTAADANAFLSPLGPVAARARDAHNAALQVSRLPWWRTLGEASVDVGLFVPAHPQELEAEFGGLYVGGMAAVSENAEVDRVNC
ncbi:IQ calmodulin-binding motif-containing protein 1 [Pholidichthys leucotaenia]